MTDCYSITVFENRHGGTICFYGRDAWCIEDIQKLIRDLGGE